MAARVQRLAAITAIVVGVGVAAAPAAFQMFTRAPEGGVMMDEFEPYMSAEVIGEFRGYLATIDAATGEMPQLRSDVADPAFRHHLHQQDASCKPNGRRCRRT